MKLRDFRRAGHAPTLFAAFLYFDVSFMVWVLIGSLANSIVPDFGLSDAQKGLMVAVPLAGRGDAAAGARRADRPDGRAADRHPGHGADDASRCSWAGSGPIASARSCWWACCWALRGRASPPPCRWPAAGIRPSIRGWRWESPGRAIAARPWPHFSAPAWPRRGAGTPSSAWPWSRCCDPGLFIIFAKDSPRPAGAPAAWPLMPTCSRSRDTWWFCLFYAVTFGGFVGLASFLNVFFLSQYGLTRIQAGNFATLCVIAGSFLRPLGGYLADRLGGVRMLLVLYLGVGVDDAGRVHPAAARLGNRAAVRGHGAAWHGQRRGVPDRPAAVLPGDRRGDRHRRRRRRVRRLLAAEPPGSLKQATGSFAGGFLTFALAGCFGCAAALCYASLGWQGGLIEWQTDPPAEVPAPLGTLVEADAFA